MLRAIVLFVALLCVGCTNALYQAQVHTANGIGTGANAALPILIDQYSNEGFRVLLEAKEAGRTRIEAEAALKVVIDKWASIWEAWEALVVAQDRWATALEEGGNTGAALVGLKSAYCGLRGVWPDNIPAVPLVPLVCP